MHIAFRTGFKLGIERWCVVCLTLLIGAASASAQGLPEELEGYWGQDNHCLAQSSVGLGTVTPDAVDAPYHLDGQWISRWHFYCRVLRLDPFGDGRYRARVLCGEDAVERGYDVDITLDTGEVGEALNLTWYSLDEGALDARPWSSGPFGRCSFPES